MACFGDASFYNKINYEKAIGLTSDYRAVCKASYYYTTQTSTFKGISHGYIIVFVIAMKS